MSLKDYPEQPGRAGYVVLKTVQPGTYLIVRTCPFCGQESRTAVPAQGLWDWEHGAFVQDAFPDLTADEREQVISGAHSACFDAAFPDEDEDDETDDEVWS